MISHLLYLVIDQGRTEKVQVAQENQNQPEGYHVEGIILEELLAEV